MLEWGVHSNCIQAALVLRKGYPKGKAHLAPHASSSLTHPLAVLSTAAGWFIWHHFWFLDIKMGGMDLKTLCVLLLLATEPALLAPGLVYTKASHLVVGGVLMVQVSWQNKLELAG